MVPRGLKHDFELFCRKSGPCNLKYESIKYKHGCSYRSVCRKGQMYSSSSHLYKKHTNMAVLTGWLSRLFFGRFLDHLHFRDLGCTAGSRSPAFQTGSGQTGFSQKGHRSHTVSNVLIWVRTCCDILQYFVTFCHMLQYCSHFAYIFPCKFIRGNRGTSATTPFVLTPSGSWKWDTYGIMNMMIYWISLTAKLFTQNRFIKRYCVICISLNELVKGFVTPEA